MPSAPEPSQDNDPFGVLHNANTVLLHNMRRDEASPELQKQLTQTGMPSSAQAYFCEPYANSYLGPQVCSLLCALPVDIENNFFARISFSKSSIFTFHLLLVYLSRNFEIALQVSYEGCVVI